VGGNELTNNCQPQAGSRRPNTVFVSGSQRLIIGQPAPPLEIQHFLADGKPIARGEPTKGQAIMIDAAMN
jgi:hypothetical protein